MKVSSVKSSIVYDVLVSGEYSYSSTFFSAKLSFIVHVLPFPLLIPSSFIDILRRNSTLHEQILHVFDVEASVIVIFAAGSVVIRAFLPSSSLTSLLRRIPRRNYPRVPWIRGSLGNRERVRARCLRRLRRTKANEKDGCYLSIMRKGKESSFPLCRYPRLQRQRG